MPGQMMKSTCIYMSKVVLLAHWRLWSSVVHTVFYYLSAVNLVEEITPAHFASSPLFFLSVYPLYCLCISLSPCPSFYPHLVFLHSFINKHTYSLSITLFSFAVFWHFISACMHLIGAPLIHAEHCCFMILGPCATAI